MVVIIAIHGFIMVLVCNFPEDSCGIHPDDMTGRFHEDSYEYCLRHSHLRPSVFFGTYNLDGKTCRRPLLDVDHISRNKQLKKFNHHDCQTQLVNHWYYYQSLSVLLGRELLAELG